MSERLVCEKCGGDVWDALIEEGQGRTKRYWIACVACGRLERVRDLPLGTDDGPPRSMIGDPADELTQKIMAASAEARAEAEKLLDQYAGLPVGGGRR